MTARFIWLDLECDHTPATHRLYVRFKGRSSGLRRTGIRLPVAPIHGAIIQQQTYQCSVCEVVHRASMWHPNMHGVAELEVVELAEYFAAVGQEVGRV